MSSRSKRRRYLQRVLADVQAELATFDQSRPAETFATGGPTPPFQPPVLTATDHTGQPEKRLWHFSHTQPHLPGILYCVVQARDLANARGTAYLLAEQFHQNVIGWLRANEGPHLPPNRAA